MAYLRKEIAAMPQVKIVTPGSSSFKAGQIVDYVEFAETSLRLHKQSKTAPTSEVVYSDKPVKVTFGSKHTLVEDGETRNYCDIYIDGQRAGDAYLTPRSDFDVRLFLVNEAMPNAQQVLTAAGRQFDTKNISVAYYNF